MSEGVAVQVKSDVCLGHTTRHEQVGINLRGFILNCAEVDCPVFGKPVKIGIHPNSASIERTKISAIVEIPEVCPALHDYDGFNPSRLPEGLR